MKFFALPISLLEMRNTIVRMVKAHHPPEDGGNAANGIHIELLKGLLRTHETYMVPLFAKVQTLFNELNEEDKDKGLFDPKLFEDDKEIFNLSLLITIVLTSPVLRSTLRNKVDWKELMKVNWDELMKAVAEEKKAEAEDEEDSN